MNDNELKSLRKKRIKTIREVKSITFKACYKFN